MSTYKSIAGVSQSLVNLLGDRLTETAAITVAPPDVPADWINGPRLNLYLYNLAENPFLKNQEIPGNGHPGIYGHPPLSLNLQYIFTAFAQTEGGPDADMQAQFILGDAMRVVHDNAVISADLMQLKSPGKTVLDLSLIDAFEQIRITLQPKSLEEISKIWTALPRVNFRRSVTYEVAVVQIDSRLARTVGLPVRERRVYALTMRNLQIEEVFRQPPLLGTKIAAVEEGETLRITGQNLQSPDTSLMVDGTIDMTAAITTLQDDLIDFSIPAGAFATGLHSLQVAQKVKLAVIDGRPPVSRGGFASNLASFQLLPKITGPATLAGPGIISVPVAPAVKPTQERSLLLGDYLVPSVPPQPSDPPANDILFQLPQPPIDPIPPGTYLTRVRIDNMESRLVVDDDPASATYLQYLTPTLTLT